MTNRIFYVCPCGSPYYFCLDRDGYWLVINVYGREVFECENCGRRIEDEYDTRWGGA